MNIKDNMCLYGSKISKNISMDNNGQLIITGAILSRTGDYDYLESDIIPNGDSNKIVKVYRKDEDVFDPVSIASFENKPFCNDHPDDDVSGDNYTSLMKGFIRNIRRGTGDLSNCVLGDIVVVDPEVIDLIKSGEKRELSLGYNAVIEKGDDGKYYMKKIRGNHLALVDNGRAGCATIRDRNNINKIGGQSGMKKTATVSSNRNRFINKLYDDDVMEVEELGDDDEMVEEEEVSEPQEEVCDDDIGGGYDVAEKLGEMDQKLEAIIAMLTSKNTVEDEEEPEIISEEPMDEDTVEEKNEEEEKVVEPDEGEQQDDTATVFDEGDDAEEEENVEEEETMEEDTKPRDSKAKVYSKFAGAKDSAIKVDIHNSVAEAFQKRYNKNGGSN